MTRLIIISSLFLALFSASSFTASAGNNKSTETSINDTKDNGTKHSQESNTASKTTHNNPVTNTVPHAHPEDKGHSPKLHELPHIHHFHRERVKKVKRHHKKVWSLSVLLLAICHISILIMAYTHVIPH